MDFEIFGQQTA